MFGVEVIKRRTEQVLVVGRPIWLRLVGAILAALSLGMIVMMGTMLSEFPTKTVLLLGGPALLGLHIALSHASVTFQASSRMCTVRQSVFGFLPWQRALEFSDVRIRRQSNWGSETAWLYRISFTPQDPRERPIRLGHMTRLTRCEALAQTIAQFAGTVALDRKGQTLSESQPASPQT